MSIEDDEFGSVRIIHDGENGNQAPWVNAQRDAKRDFMERIAVHGFTLLPETIERWWPRA